MKTLLASLSLFYSLSAADLPEPIQKIMNESKYEHAIWGLYVKDLETGKILYDLNSNLLFSPASTSKLFSTAALLNAFGDDYRFKTPIVATASIVDGELKGDLILIGQGDLTFGGRQPNADTIAFTKMDHIVANNVPGVILTKEDPLTAVKSLAKQLYDKGLRKLSGDVLIDDSLFDTTHKRDFVLSPVMINENLIDLTINPSAVGQKAELSVRPIVEGYVVDNQLVTVAADEPLQIEVTSDGSGKNVVVRGKVPMGQYNLIRTASVQDPNAFTRAALIQAMKAEGIVLDLKPAKLPSSYPKIPQLAVWTSPPLSEYVKLILKVSHNLGADLVPLLLASQNGKKTFDEGMRMIGNFLEKEVKLSGDVFVLLDAAGGNENRLTPQAEIQLLEYMHHLSPSKFEKYFDALPILGVDGSLEDFAKKSNGAGKVRSKPGTGIAFNPATGKLFLITQALGGYIEGKNGHLFAYMVAVNNGKLPTIDDIFGIFEDVSQISSALYDNTN